MPELIESSAVESQVLEAPVVETPKPAVSIKDHASQFSPERQEVETEEIPKTPANTGQFAPKPTDAKHRATSQRATPEDVAEINRLTKELRETEARLADKDPHAQDSPRIRTLKRQLAALKTLETPAPDPPKPSPATAPAASTEFTDKEPVFDDFSADPTTYPDPLAAYLKALARFEARRDRWEETQQARNLADEARHAERRASFHARQTAFVKTKPDYETVAAPFFERTIGPILLNAIVQDDNGPAFVYHLAQHPELADELIFLTQGKELSEASVAVVQRRLQKELSQGQAVSTGSVAPARPYSPPKPPNPVRTGPIKTADEPPDQASSISEHKRYFAKKDR